MSSVAITGGYGFLGWHLACRLRAVDGVESVRLGRAEFADPSQLVEALAGVETIYHLAGVNRAESDEAVERENLAVAQALAAAVTAAGRPVHVVYGNSIQARVDSAYGRGKAGGAQILTHSLERVGGTFTDIVLPNLFGEHGRPAYNSFVATFCHEIAHGRRPQVTGDKPVRLLHAQAAAQTLMSAAAKLAGSQVAPGGEEHLVSEVLQRIERCHELYAEGEVPPLSDPFSTDLFNTYRSHVFPQHFPFPVEVRRDNRGDLFEAVRAHGGTGQTFVSTTVPGATRGDHYHLRKFERFFVVKGDAEIALRRIYHDDIVRFRLRGDEPSFVDMPTLWVHNITNVGDSELVTMFWTDQLLDPAHPDQYPERVEESCP